MQQRLHAAICVSRRLRHATRQLQHRRQRHLVPKVEQSDCHRRLQRPYRNDCSRGLAIYRRPTLTAQPRRQHLYRAQALARGHRRGFWFGRAAKRHQRLELRGRPGRHRRADAALLVTLMCRIPCVEPPSVNNAISLKKSEACSSDLGVPAYCGSRHPGHTRPPETAPEGRA